MLEEAEARAAAAEEGRIRAEAESTKWHGVSRKFFDSVGFSGDIVTKVQLFDQCMKKPDRYLRRRFFECWSTSAGEWRMC